jgi:hypothetical protein
MNINKYISAFSKLGEKLQDQDNIPSEIIFRAEQQNNWFTKESVSVAIKSLSELLNEKTLIDWTSTYDFTNLKGKKVGVIMAGNIPLVGFTDFLAIIVSGHIAKIKLSSQDNILLPYAVDLLLEIEPTLANQIEFVEQLKDIEVVIATGSDNTSRYFEYYFGKYPNIIRKNRSSCAVLNGKETPEAIDKLGFDIFRYYGLGCRNVSKVYFPKDYKIENLLAHLDNHKEVINHHKYNNNYDYNKSIYLVNLVKHFDNGYLLLTEDSNLVSPISVLFYETYDDQDHLDKLIANQKDKIQCIVSNKAWYNGSLPFGSAQKPSLNDYADNIDVMSFLTNLK